MADDDSAGIAGIVKTIEIGSITDTSDISCESMPSGRLRRVIWR